MVTRPITESSIETRPQRHGISRSVLTRAAWLVADVGAIASCVVLAVHGLA
jgi:hypothetical protein